MQLEWISYPITQYSLTGVGLISSLCLWASAKVEIRSVRNGMKKSIAALDSGVQNLSSGVQNLSSGLEEVRITKTAAPEPIPMVIPQGLNLTKRTQILRMQRRGESLNSIAAALQLPLGEVTLILKLDRLQGPIAETEPRAAQTPAQTMTRGVA